MGVWFAEKTYTTMAVQAVVGATALPLAKPPAEPKRLSS